jgi:heptosyltransferase-3
MNQKAPRILFITSTRIGDAVLSMGILTRLIETYPGARLTIVCGTLCLSLFEGVPGLERLIGLKKQTWNRHWIELWSMVVGTKWDVVVDLRNSAVSRLISAQQRYSYGPHIDKGLHKVAQNAAVLNLKDVPFPKFYPSPAQQEWARAMIPDGGPVLGIGPAANWIGKTWPQENFIELIKKMTAPGAICEGWRIAVFAAPGEETIARPVLESVPENLRIDGIAKGSPGEAIAAIARCSLYIGNDSGLMHGAAASGIPTVGLFGPTDLRKYAPFGPRATYVSTPQSAEELLAPYGTDFDSVSGSLMSGLTVDSVFHHVCDFCLQHLLNRL